MVVLFLAFPQSIGSKSWSTALAERIFVGVTGCSKVVSAHICVAESTTNASQVLKKQMAVAIDTNIAIVDRRAVMHGVKEFKKASAVFKIGGKLAMAKRL